MEKHRWIYDEECYPNAFVLCAKIPGEDTRVTFQISSLADQRVEMAKWLLNEVEDMVGFFNTGYDYAVLHKILTELMDVHPRVACKRLFKFSSTLIKGQKYSKAYYPVRKQIDVFKINHFDNGAKMTSLKLLEFNLKMRSIQELPYPPDTVLTHTQLREVIEYCKNDVDATELVYDKTLPEIILREKMSDMFNIDFTNFNASKMGEYILLSKIISQLGEDVVYNVYETDTGTKKKIRQTKRKSIALSDVVFDYIDFETTPFQKILAWFKGRTITETKGVFSKIPFDELEILEPHYHVNKTVGKQKTLNVINFGFQYDFGVGGIHGSVEPGVYIPGETEMMLDIDVASYYPNLAIQNKFYPEHLGKEFCDIYESIYIERQKYPKSTHKMENLALKLALNGSYGKSNSKHSALYDPMYTMKTTVNGQLLLCMLSEQLMLHVADCKMIQINTDGMTIVFPKHLIGIVKMICKEWERKTKLELEEIEYSKMIIKDVNNYIAVSLDGNYIKRKGAAFIYKENPGELELHKNFSQLIVPKALEAYFVHNVLPEEFIPNHDNMFDFFKRTKIIKNHQLLARKYDNIGNIIEEIPMQRVTRYVISGSNVQDKEDKFYKVKGSGMTLMKVMPPLDSKVQKAIEDGMIEAEAKLACIRQNNVEAGWLCTEFNTINSLADVKQAIYYPYYIEEVYKIINVIQNQDGTIDV